MEKNELAKALEEVRSDFEVTKALREQGTAETPEEAAAVWAKALADKGYDVSPEEISAYICEAEEEMKQKTEETEIRIQVLEDQDLEAVAGGKGHDSCRSSYLDRENCWVMDGCDNVAVIYPDYKCHKVFMDVCDSALT